ncbi:MAG: DedA family protein [Rhodobacterales bacterium]|nr:DedA family protein [Rhodobacterales bacterium]
MDAIAQAVVDFIAQNRAWAFWVALVFAAAETTALVSILIPSTAILIGVGAFVATGALDFLPIWAGASVGAVIGSTFSWWLGLRHGSRILGLWPLRDHPDLVDQGRGAFVRWGTWAIIVGHFVGPLRPVVFLLCGMAPMPLWRFQLFNIPGALAWAWAMPMTGAVGGDLIGWLWQALPF